VAHTGQWVGHGGDREWPELQSPFTFSIGPFVERVEEAYEARSGAGFAGRVIVGCDESRRWPDFDGGFHEFAVNGASCREFRRFEILTLVKIMVPVSRTRMIG
jgi:hypothetical protein